MTSVRTKSSKRKVKALIRSLPKNLRGAKTLWVRIGLTALKLIHEAFLVKAKGGTDAAGLSWPPLAPSTIAYKRRHPGFNRRTGNFTRGRLPGSRARSAFAPSWILTQKQRDRWWSLYGGFLSRYKGDKAHAAATAWSILKAEGARTIMGVYGGAKVDILIDLGLLEESLRPGAQPDQATASPPRVVRQVFKVGGNAVTVGTRRKWAWTHHKGIPGRLPQRKLWPDSSDWPSDWWGEILKEARAAVKEHLIHTLKGVP